MHLFNRNNRVRPFKNKASYFQHRPWQLVTLFEEYYGVWPCQNNLKQYLLQLFHFVNLSITMFALMNGLMALIGSNIDVVLETVIIILFIFNLIVKQVSSFIFQRRRLKVYEKIVEHYETLSDPEEAAILRESADQGLKFTTGYVCIGVLFLVLFMGMPIAREFYDYCFGNGDLKLVLPFEMDYGVNHEKYWFYIFLQFCLLIYSGFFVEVGFDLSFILQTRYVQALFKIVRLRLDKASDLADKLKNDDLNDDDEPYSVTLSTIRLHEERFQMRLKQALKLTDELKDNGLSDNDEPYSVILSAIRLHEECFQMVEMIQKVYGMVWFMLLFLNATVFGAGLHIVTTKVDDPLETFRYFSGFLLLTMHFQIIFSHGQKIIDSSNSIYDACFESRCLDLSTKSRKLLGMVMLRSTKICQITGSEFFPLSIETFGKMFKAGLSYYTVFKN